MEDNYDKLDDFFKKQLSDHTPDGAWNIPDDALFENAISSVNIQSKKYNWKQLLWILPLLLLGFIFWNQYQIHSQFTEVKLSLSSIQSELSSAENQVNQLQEELKTKNEWINDLRKSQGERKDVKTITEVNQDENSDEVVAINDSSFPNVKETSQNRIDVKSDLKNDLSKKVSTETSASEQKLESNHDAKVIQTPPVFATIDRLSTLNHQVKSNLSIDHQYKGEIIPFAATGKKQSLSKFELGLNFVMNSAWVKMSKLKATNQEGLKEYDNGHGCFGARLTSIYHINDRWSIQAQLGYNRFVNYSNVSRNFFFDMDNVDQDQQGNEVYNLEVAMQNPFGEFDSQTTFRVSDDMEQNCVIKETTNVRQKLDVLTFAVGSTYDVIRKDKLDVYLGGGFGLNHIVRLKNEFDVSYFMDESLRHQYKDVTMKLEGVNNWYKSAYANLGFTYRITKQLGLNIESRYDHGLSSIRDSWPNSGPKTFLHHTSLDLGIRYRM